MTSAAVFSALADGMVDFDADMLEKLSSDLAAVSARAFGRTASSRDTASALPMRCARSQCGGIAGDHLSRIRESVLGLQRIIGAVSEMAADWLQPELRRD